MPLRPLILLGLMATAASAESPRVAADIGPVHSLVAQVMDGVGEPALLVRPGASPHGHALRPSEARAVQDADLVVWIGPGLEPWLEAPIATLSTGATLELLEVPGTVLLPYRDGHDDEGPDGAGHDHGGADPHAWLDPRNGRVWLAAIADTLGRLDPENAAIYRANAAAGQAEIDAAEADARRSLAPHLGTPFVVYHDAYQYLEARLGLERATALAHSDAAPPAPARLAEVSALLRETDAPCVFAEPQFGPGPLRTVTEGTGARTVTLDPLGGALAAGPSLYPDLIRDLADTIAECGNG